MIQCKTDMNNSEQKYTPYTDSLMFAAELLVRAARKQRANAIRKWVLG